LIFTETKLRGAFILDVKKLEDERGFFGRTFCQKEFEEHGMNPNVVQANVSYNKIKGTLRGMHFQAHPYEETKLVRCVRGAIYDVIIDLRKDSPTYTQWIGVELKEDSYRMLFVPEGFGHGFITLADNTEVIYQVSQFYTPGSEKGIRWNDPAFDIQWPIEPVLISEKDRQHSDYII
jgi:dTDP-4-dehydrorhamnose 3,5-epimerase